jgi:glycosyltransferase involved in cell wall biosynthesis
MKLLFVLAEYVLEPVGGIRTFYVSLLPALVRAGCEVKVLLARREFAGNQSFTDESGVEVEYLCPNLLARHDLAYQESQFAGNWLMGQFVPVANAAFEQSKGGEGFDIVEVTDWPMLFVPWVALRKAEVPFTISLHSSVGQMLEYEAKRESGRLDFALVRMFEALGFAAAQSIHANSNLNARYWEKITNRKVDVLLPLLQQKEGTTKDTNQHEKGKADLTTEDTESAIERRGRREMEQSEVGPKGEGVSTTESKNTKGEAGQNLTGQVSASESDSLASKLADSPVSESLTRSASIPASLPATSHPPPATPRLRGAVFARLQNLKGCELLAEALRDLPDMEIDWYGKDMGNSAEGRMWSESLVTRFPTVFGMNFIYHGVVAPDRVPALMAEADFVCVPSLWDVFNLSAVEAMELGRVVLCSRQAGAEMLIEDGVNGFLFEPECPGDLAEKLKRISLLDQEQRRAIGLAAQESLRRKLDSEMLVRERLAYYQKVAGTKPETNRNCFLPEILELKPVVEKTWGRRLYEFRRKIGI